MPVNRPRAALAALAGGASALLLGIGLLPVSGVDTHPPVCWAAGGYEVSCATGPSWAVVIGGGAVAAALAWRLLRARPE